MMPHDGDTPSRPATITTTTKDHENQSSDGKKITTTKPPEQGLKCPRCDSPNTKFCYYNNYSLTQPRHFCKTCRRYWTKGGALRNVPIGGGCRKNKKGIKPSSSSSSSLSSRSLSCDSGGSSSDQLSSLKFFHGLSTPLDFHLGGLTFPSSSRLQQQQHHLPIATGFYNNQFSSFGDLSASSSATISVSGFQLLDPSSAGGSSSLIGLNYPFSSSTGSGLFSGGGGAIQGVNTNVNSLNVHSSLASSIESLSSLNQDLHWKLQQQRLAMLFGGENRKDDNNNNNSVSFSPVVSLENQTTLQRPQPILFQNLEISKPSAAESGFLVGDSSSSRKEGTNGVGTDTTPTEWFFGNSYASVAPTPTSTGSGGGGGNNGHDNNASNNWGGGTGVHAWGDVQQQPYSALP